jgi:hypothetical protein
MQERGLFFRNGNMTVKLVEKFKEPHPIKIK